jgi:hypothetical protein
MIHIGGNWSRMPKNVSDHDAGGVQLKAIRFDDSDVERALAGSLTAQQKFTAAEIKKASKSPDQHEKAHKIQNKLVVVRIACIDVIQNGCK